MAAASPAAHTGCVGDGVHLGLYRPPTQPHAREMAATHLEALRRCCCPLQGQASGGGTGLETQGGGEAVGLLLGSCPTPPHPRAAAGGGAQGSLRCMPTSAARELAPCWLLRDCRLREGRLHIHTHGRARVPAAAPPALCIRQRGRGADAMGRKEKEHRAWCIANGIEPVEEKPRCERARSHERGRGRGRGRARGRGVR